MLAQTGKPTLYIFSGLPACGKSTLAQKLAQYMGASFIRIDTIEQGLRDLCSYPVEGEGYRLAYRIASDNLRLGHSVIADSCNPIELTRREWEQVAIDAGAQYFNIDIICSDIDEHQRRVEERVSEVTGLRLPTWAEVRDRILDQWTVDRIIVDTANRSVDDGALELLMKLGLQERPHRLSGR